MDYTVRTAVNDAITEALEALEKLNQALKGHADVGSHNATCARAAYILINDMSRDI